METQAQPLCLKRAVDDSNKGESCPAIRLMRPYRRILRLPTAVHRTRCCGTGAMGGTGAERVTHLGV